MKAVLRRGRSARKPPNRYQSQSLQDLLGLKTLWCLPFKNRMPLNSRRRLLKAKRTQWRKQMHESSLERQKLHQAVMRGHVRFYWSHRNLLKLLRSPRPKALLFSKANSLRSSQLPTKKMNWSKRKLSHQITGKAVLLQRRILSHNQVRERATARWTLRYRT